MLQELVYWVYYFFIKKKYIKNGDLLDVALFVSLFLLGNIMSIFYVVEYYIGYNFLHYIPIHSKRDITSWLCAIVLVSPFVYLIYSKYLKKEYLLKLDHQYQQKSPRRLLLGKLCCAVYVMMTWVVFFVVMFVFKH